MLGANTHCSVFRLLVCEDHPPCFCFLLLESLQKVWAQEKEWGLASYRATQLGLDWCQRSSCLFLSANLRLISWQSLIWFQPDLTTCPMSRLLLGCSSLGHVFQPWVVCIPLWLTHSAYTFQLETPEIHTFKGIGHRTPFCLLPSIVMNGLFCNGGVKTIYFVIKQMWRKLVSSGVSVSSFANGKANENCTVEQLGRLTDWREVSVIVSGL